MLSCCLLRISFHLTGIKKVKKISLLGVDKNLKYTVAGDSVKVTIPTALQASNKLLHTATFKIQY